jgi:hypothetical protein
VFTFGLAVESIKELGGASTMLILDLCTETKAMQEKSFPNGLLETFVI